MVMEVDDLYIMVLSAVCFSVDNRCALSSTSYLWKASSTSKMSYMPHRVLLLHIDLGS